MRVAHTVTNPLLKTSTTVFSADLLGTLYKPQHSARHDLKLFKIIKYRLQSSFSI